MTLPRRASVYEQLRPHLDAGDLIRRLGLEESRRLGSEAYCKPLCHDSTSGESLQINLHTGRWNCKACQSAGVKGDLVQLVEYALTGGRAPSHGEAQGASATHRQAVQWLCQQYGVAFRDDHATLDAGLEVVHIFAMFAHEYLLSNAQAQQWVLDRWGFDLATIEQYGIGFMPSPLLPALVAEAHSPQSRNAFKASGLGWYTTDGQWKTRFEGRVTFPYLEHGKAVYLIGRATPWTPPLDNGAKPPKYHKLSVHSPEKEYISERVTNDHLYNERVMDATDCVVVAEGVADAVALSSLGVPVVSPVTISFNEKDLERFTRKARENHILRVEILFDNELSGSGNWAARRVGAQLAERGIVTRILTLPLDEQQENARNEVLKILGPDLFAELERSEPNERKKLIARTVADEATREWLMQNIEASKIDAAEWSARMGAGAAGRFDQIRKSGRDIIELLVDDVVAKGIDETEDPSLRLGLFNEIITLAAHIEDALARSSYASTIARAAGKGVTKADVVQRIGATRKAHVKPRRVEERQDDRPDPQEVARNLILLPPEPTHTQPIAPAPPAAIDPTKPAPPPAPRAPGAEVEDAHTRYAPVRDNVEKSVEAKLAPERVGEYVAQTITMSMGFTPFRTPDELFLVRGSERIATGLERPSARFETLLFLASGLTSKKSSHRAYIAAVVYFLERVARAAADVSWSYVAPDRAVFFPTGDGAGRILKIEPGRVTRTKMSDERVPTVPGADFNPISYVESDGGVAAVLEAFRWTSISPGDRLVLVHWVVCLPILRRIGVIPVVRIEGGSSSGKTRTVDAVSYLVNGRKSSSVPTAAALASRMSIEMLTIDDNRESNDITPALLSTILQATHLGAKEKRKVNADTGTVVERVCGALLMNGIEPIHDGRSEIVSRMLTLRADTSYRASDSPTAEEGLREALLASRNAFWSDAIRRCARALELDEEYGEHVGAQIEQIFGDTKIGRLSAYIRMMYLTWVVGLPPAEQAQALEGIEATWRRALATLGSNALDSLVNEELAVTCIRYAFAFGESTAKTESAGFGGYRRVGLEGKYIEAESGEVYLGPLRATHLARLVREGAKAMNAPTAITNGLRAGQLEQRLLDGVAFLEAAGFEVSIEMTSLGQRRFTFRRVDPLPPPAAAASGDTWQPS